MTPSCLLTTTTLIMTLAVTTRVRADEDPPGRTARLSFIEGDVSFQPAGEVDWSRAELNRPLTLGDRLWADSNARVELGLGTTSVRLGPTTAFAFLDLNDDVDQMQLTQGTLAIRVRSLEPDETIEVDTPNLAFTIQTIGDYRLDVSEDGLTTGVSVRTGSGEVQGGGETFMLGVGQHGDFVGSETLQVTLREARAHDDFDRWCQSRDRRTEGGTSVQYVSTSVVGWEDLDEHGSWYPNATYGYLWFPALVAASWAPYRYGHWEWIPPWGWTWVDDAPWGFAPFHYGRWIYVNGRWGWFPGPLGMRAVYAPAFVVFVRHGPQHRHVGWFPLGPRDAYTPGHYASQRYWERVNQSSALLPQGWQAQRFESDAELPRDGFANRFIPNAISSANQESFAAPQALGHRPLDPREPLTDDAALTPYAPVAPTRANLYGSAPVSNRLQPPLGTQRRAVVVRRVPPAAAVPFANQAPALGAHPGRPLAKPQVDSLRLTGPKQAPAIRPLPPQTPPDSPQTLERRDRPAAAQPPHTTPMPKPPSQPPPTPPDRPASPPRSSTPNRPATSPAPRPHENPAPTRRVEPAPTPHPKAAPRPAEPAPAPTKKKAKGKDKKGTDLFDR